MIGQKISPILEEIENTLWDFEANGGLKQEYSIDGFRAAIKIFMSVLMDKIWELQENEKMDIQDRLSMVERAGEDIRELIKTYTNIDCHELY
jgi:hypothetical protein